MPKIKNILLGIDMALSTLTGGLPGSTLSGRAGTAQAEGKLKGRLLAPLINFIMMDPNHCKDAIQNDINRAKAVIADESKEA